MVGSDKYWTVYSDFLLSVMGCKKRQPAQFEDLSTKSILEKILRMNKSQKSHRKLFSEDKKGLRRFKSSPNIYAEVTGNFSLKPTISIKRGHTDKLGGNYRFCDFASEKEYKSLSASLDYRKKCCSIFDWSLYNTKISLFVFATSIFCSNFLGGLLLTNCTATPEYNLDWSKMEADFV